MKPLTADFIIKNSKPHPMRQGRMFTTVIGDYILSIVGGSTGLYGDFKDDFEVALLEKDTGKFVTSFYSKRGDDVLGYATIDEINDLYFNIPRTK